MGRKKTGIGTVSRFDKVNQVGIISHHDGDEEKEIQFAGKVVKGNLDLKEGEVVKFELSERKSVIGPVADRVESL